MHCFVVCEKNGEHPKNHHMLAQAHALGFTGINRIECQDVYLLQGPLTADEKKILSENLLIDSFTQHGKWEKDAYETNNIHLINIVYKAGVTDVVAEEIMRRAQMLGVNNLKQAASGQRYLIHSKESLTAEHVETVAKRLLCNDVIQTYFTHRHCESSEAIENSATILDCHALHARNDVGLLTLTSKQLCQLSTEKRAALDEAEMLAIQNYFRTENREPTDVEFEMIAQTWSEHCSHKTFKARINMDGEIIDGLLNTFIRKATEEIAAPWVHSAFVDNAGIIEFDNEHQISFKVETHNHPSAIEPFGGANTGLGGVIRDILGVSAKPIAATNVFCFAPQNTSLFQIPEGTLHPQLISSGVIAGVQDYGNKTGIPTVNGAIWYNEGYIANPLVYCGCVGLAPKNKHPRAPQPGDKIIILGARTGRDGLRGATFSSMTMDAQTGAVAGASVQIGNPIVCRGLIEVITRARDAELYHAMTDCGAGGLSSAVGEMASSLGAEVELSEVKLKYQGLAPWEIWLSEAQERMVVAVPAHNMKQLKTLCENFDVEFTDIGYFVDSGNIVVRYFKQEVLKLSNDFLHKGMPQKTLLATKPKKNIPENNLPENMEDYADKLLKLLSHPNIASKERYIRGYDHEVQGATVVKPLTGAQNDGPSDACVLKPMNTKGNRGIVLSNGLNPELGKVDAYAMAVSAVDEAIRNAVAVGADPARIAILDNFCWGNPNRPETLGALVEAARGCYDAALHYKTPFISGKDSLNNEHQGADKKLHAIPPTLLISAIGIINDVSNAVTMDFKAVGNCVYLLEQAKKHSSTTELPPHAPELYACLHNAINQKLVRACHDLSEGGLAVAAAEMCIGGRLGCVIDIEKDPSDILFNESNGRFLVEVELKHCEQFEQCFAAHLSVNRIGIVHDASAFHVSHHGQSLFHLPLEKMLNAFFNQNENSHAA